jgi:pimeloyl-ACP methyl ester carboxylesterase
VTIFTNREVDAGGLRTHIAEQGDGELVVLLHGFPETSYSWRHQFDELAAAGYHVVAPDLRGFGRTERPADVGRYTMLELVGDVVALIDALGERQAVVVGHDMGSLLAWYTAMLRPDRVRAVAGIGVLPWPPAAPSPLVVGRQMFGDGFYHLYFQEPGVADAELALDPTRTLRQMLYSGSADGPRGPLVVPPGGGFLDTGTDPEVLPSWLTEDDVAAYVADFSVSGFTGGLNWYRNLDRNQELLKAWRGAAITQPALYIAGELDPVADVTRAAGMRDQPGGLLPNLRSIVEIPNCGHWTQQERPAEVNAALLEFLKSL